MQESHTYDAAKLADMGYGDSGDGATVEMTDDAVADLAACFDGQTDATIDDMIAEIETARID